jgi:protein O-GlcNAc transferase
LPRIADPIEAGLWTNFYLAYHGLPDRELQQQTARTYLQICPELAHVAAHCQPPRRPGRIRVGLISQFFYNHSIGRTSKGLFAHLDRERDLHRAQNR